MSAADAYAITGVCMRGNYLNRRSRDLCIAKRNARMDYAFKIFGDFFYLDGAAR